MYRSDTPALSLGQKAEERHSWARVIFSTSPLSKATNCLEIGAAAVAGLFMLAFVVIASLRLPYPFEINWSESAMHSMVAARMLGRPLYTSPSIFDGASCLYPPFFVDLSALVGRLLHIDGNSVSFLPMRLVSIVSSAGIFIGALWVLRGRKAMTWRMAFALAAIFPATYGRLEFWYDNARVDTLFVFLLFVSTALLLESESLWSAALAGVFGALATLTKQPGLLLMGLVGLDTVFVKRRVGRAAAFALAFACSILTYLWVNGDLLNPLFYFWMLRAAGSRPLLWASFLRGPLFLVAVIPFAVFFAAAALILRFRSRGEASAAPLARLEWSWSLVFGLWTLASLILRAKEGASINYFMPSISVGAMAIAEGTRWIARHGLDERRIAGLAAVAQLAMLAYNPALFLPTAEAVKEAGQLVETLKKVDGPIWFPTFPSFAAMAGKPWVAHYGTLTDLDVTNPGQVARDVSRAIRSRWFGALILPPNDRFVNMTELRQFYQEQPFPEIRSPFLRRSFNMEFGAILVRRSTTPS
jgi:hypothetical protein